MVQELPGTEKVKQPENTIRYKLTAPLTIAGPSGVGKTTVSRELGAWLGIKPVKLGDRIRKQVRREGGQVLDYVDRTEEEDQARDALVADILRESIAKNEPTIVEARLSGWIGKQVEEGLAEEGKPGKVITILLTTNDPHVRFDRLHRREKKKPGNHNLDQDESRRLTLSREEGDWQAWRRATPDLGYLNPSAPYDPHWIYNSNNPNKLYDIVIATDNMTVEQVTVVIQQELIARGLVEQIA